MLLIVGVLLGFWFWTVIILPLFYGIPKSIYYISKGLLKKSSVILYLKSFILWNFLFLAISVILAKFFPKVSHILINSGTFAIGQFIGIGVAAIYMVSKKCRYDLNLDFWDVMIIRSYCKTNDFVSRQKLAEIIKDNFIERYGDQAEEKLKDWFDNLGKK